MKFLYYDENENGEIVDAIANVNIADVLKVARSGKVENAFLNSKNGEIIIVHFNHPESQTKDGMISAIKKLKNDGYKFVRLSDYSLK